MNEITWTDDDVKFVEKAIEIRNRGYYIDSAQLVDRYNKILHKNRARTSCGACLRAIVSELETALNRFKMQLETNRKQNEEQVPQDETITKVEKPKKNIRRKKDVVS